MDIQKIAMKKMKPAKYNPRKDLRPGDPEFEKLKKSMNEFGYVEPLVWNKRTGNLVGGHQRYKVLESEGVEETDVSVVDLDDEREKALNIALNKISGDWDMPKLKDLLEDLDNGLFDISLTGFDMDEIELLMTQFREDEENESENPYTDKVTAPLYEITGEEPEIPDLFDSGKTEDLIQEIRESGLSEEQKDFLIKAAYRHTVFQYDAIAEYYAHAGEEMQDLMEKSALVIIDYEKAIENGYVKLSAIIEEMAEDDHEE